MTLIMGAPPALALLFLFAAPASCRTWNVLQNGFGNAPTIQAGIDSAANSDVVLIGPGTYFENLNLRGKSIELRSSSGPEATVIDGSQGNNTVITCDSGETNTTVISGLTITGGIGFAITAFSRFGGAFRLQDSCPRIEGNIIRGNTALGEFGSSSRGGAITLGGSIPCNVVIRNNLFEDNTARANGGAINIEGPCVIEGNVFGHNRTLKGDGGGVYSIYGIPIHIQSNLFLENEAADHGGAIYIGRATQGPASEVQIVQNIMIANTAFGKDSANDCTGGAIFLGGAGAVVQRNSIAFNSGDANNADAAGGICLYRTNSDVLIEGNLLFRNHEGAVRGYWNARGIAEHNLIFDNGPDDIMVYESSALIVQDNLFEDPFFCVWGPESRAELAWYSPALHSRFGILGAVEVGSCGPQLKTPVQLTTWGRLKARYR